MSAKNDPGSAAQPDPGSRKFAVALTKPLASAVQSRDGEPRDGQPETVGQLLARLGRAVLDHDHTDTDPGTRLRTSARHAARLVADGHLVRVAAASVLLVCGQAAGVARVDVEAIIRQEFRAGAA